MSHHKFGQFLGYVAKSVTLAVLVCMVGNPSAVLARDDDTATTDSNQTQTNQATEEITEYATGEGADSLKFDFHVEVLRSETGRPFQILVDGEPVDNPTAALIVRLIRLKNIDTQSGMFQLLPGDRGGRGWEHRGRSNQADTAPQTDGNNSSEQSDTFPRNRDGQNGRNGRNANDTGFGRHNGFGGPDRLDGSGRPDGIGGQGGHGGPPPLFSSAVLTDLTSGGLSLELVGQIFTVVQDFEPTLHPRLLELQKTEPQRFERELRRVAMNYISQLEQLRNDKDGYQLQVQDRRLEIQSLELQYEYTRVRDTQNEDEISRIREALRDVIVQRFDVRQLLREHELELFQNQLESLKLRLDKRLERKEVIVEHRLERMTSSTVDDF